MTDDTEEGEKPVEEFYIPPWIEAYAAQLDLTLVENALKKTIAERLQANEEMNRWYDECQRIRNEKANQ